MRALAEKLGSELGRKVSTTTGDVSKEVDVEGLVTRTVEEFGGLDVVSDFDDFLVDAVTDFNSKDGRERGYPSSCFYHRQ
jgi:hypothetical protein